MKNGFRIQHTEDLTNKMEPYISLVNTLFDTDKHQFTDRIVYDGYEFSIIVGSKNIHNVAQDMDYLFQTPKVSGTPNIANMNYWEFRFYDVRGRECRVEKNGEYIYFTIPRYQIISTDVSSGIAYLRIFHDTVKHLVDVVDESLNTAQILCESD